MGETGEIEPFDKGGHVVMLNDKECEAPAKVVGHFNTLDLTGAGEANNPGGRVAVEYDANPENGTVHFLDANGVVTGSVRFEEIKYVIEDVTSFLPRTLIATPKGEVSIENLKIGDRVVTRDNGLQEIKWIGRRDLSEADLLLSQRLRPVMIRAGALGVGVPETDTMLSPNHRVLVTNSNLAPESDQNGTLVAASDMVNLPGVDLMDPQDTTYTHLIFARHEVILCNGAWVESFHAGDVTFRGAGNAQRLELLELYPELRKPDCLGDYKSAPHLLKKHQA